MRIPNVTTNRGRHRENHHWLRPLSLALFLLLPLAAAADETDRIAELEARVAELEALVRTLAAERETPAPEAPVADTVATTDETRVEAIAEREVEEGLAAWRAEQEAADRKHSYRFGGYIKTDVIYSDYDGGVVANKSPGRDFYIPATVPVGNEGESYLDLHAKESRFFFRSDHHLDSGDEITTYLELDFLVGDNGDERISNSYQARMRHAYFTWNRWLFGQTWLTFQNVAVLPEALDFIGPSEATVFGRQAMVRYTNGPWQFAVENPETTITPFGGGDRIEASDGHVPAFVARYNLKRDWGHFTVAALARQLRYENAAEGIDSDSTGYGLSLSGLHRVGARDDFRWMATAGSGLGRYLGLNAANGAVLDADGELENIDSWAAFAAYRHWWSANLRSSAVLGYLDVDNDTELTGLDATSEVTSFHLNLIYSPLPKLDLGVEYIFANREIESGEDGDMNRFQFSAKYAY
ncbi:MAG: DcaP family trimeric outer membrane transporter [Gammaproteobacteria bacterium]